MNMCKGKLLPVEDRHGYHCYTDGTLPDGEVLVPVECGYNDVYGGECVTLVRRGIHAWRAAVQQAFDAESGLTPEEERMLELAEYARDEAWAAQSGFEL